MKNLLISTTMIKSAIFYATATLFVFGAYFTAPVTAQAAVTTYIIDVTGNGCGNYCAELEAYLASVNGNANGTSTNTNTNSTSTPSAPVAPILGYQYSSSTLAYYRNNQSPAATSSLYKYPTYSYFRDPNTTAAAPYGYYQYPTLQYAYYNGKTSAPAQTKKTSNQTSYQQAPAAKLPGFIMTSGK